MKFSFVLIVFVVLTACRNNKPLPTVQAPYIDSVLREYIAFIDTFGVEWDYMYEEKLKIVKKTLEKDTGYFKELAQALSEYKEFIAIAGDDNSCVERINIRNIDCNEAYQFNFEGTVVSKGYLITAYRKDSTYFLDYKKYWSGRGDVLKCTVETHIQRKLTQEEWNGITKAIRFADFWGMKYQNKDHGVDGSYWTVTGIRDHGRYSEKKDFHIVYRWSPYYTAFAIVGKYFIALEDNKTDYPGKEFL